LLFLLTIGTSVELGIASQVGWLVINTIWKCCFKKINTIWKSGCDLRMSLNTSMLTIAVCHVYIFHWRLAFD
jgi:hypothetical protein